MPSTNERKEVGRRITCEAILEKAQWAHDHLIELQGICSAFHESNPYSVLTENDADPSQGIYRYAGSRAIPRDISGHVGDILHNLRSTLDHLAWQLVLANGGTPDTRTCFPIDKRKPTSKKDKALFARRTQGMGKDAVKAIKACKPYQRGNRYLWLIHELNRIDKHRKIVRIGTAHTGQSPTPSERESLEATYMAAHPNAQVLPDFSQAIIPSQSIRILKAGDILQTVPKSEMEDNKDFHFQVAFDVPGVIRGESVTDVLFFMNALVFGIVRDFYGHI